MDLQFKEMRAAVGIDQATDILDHIYALPEREQTEAFARIQEIEHRAMRNQVPQAGLVTLMEYLDRHGILKAICTRNFECVHPVSNPTRISALIGVLARQSIIFSRITYQVTSMLSLRSLQETFDRPSPHPLGSYTLLARGILPMRPTR